MPLILKGREEADIRHRLSFCRHYVRICGGVRRREYWFSSSSGLRVSWKVLPWLACSSRFVGPCSGTKGRRALGIQFKRVPIKSVIKINHILVQINKINVKVHNK